MSTNKLDALRDKSFAKYISLFSVNNRRLPGEDLADFVRRIRVEKGLSLKGVEDAAARGGATISKGYVGQIENRHVIGSSVTPQKLKALAVGLQISEDEVFAVARGTAISIDPTYDEQRLLEFFRTLTPEWRDELLAHAELTSKRHRQEATPAPPAKPPHRMRRKQLHATDKTPDHLKKKDDDDEGNKRRAK